MAKYYKKLPDGQWKTYLFCLRKKGTEQRLYLKPGITEFKDIEARMFFNNLNEEESFIQHFDPKPMWSGKFPNKAEAEKVEKELLEYFGDKVNIGFKTGGYTEVRKYDHQKWMIKREELYKY